LRQREESVVEKVAPNVFRQNDGVKLQPLPGGPAVAAVQKSDDLTSVGIRRPIA